VEKQNQNQSHDNHEEDMEDDEHLDTTGKEKRQLNTMEVKKECTHSQISQIQYP